MRKKLFRSFSSVVLVVVLLLSVASISASADLTAKVKYDTWSREGPGNNYKPYRQFYAGETVTVLSMDSAGWCKIKYGSNSCYIHSWYLEQAKDTVVYKDTPTPAYVKRDGAVLRVGPNEAYPGVKTLDKGQTLLVTEEHTNGWRRVLVNGYPGYVYVSYIEQGYYVAPTGYGGNVDAYVVNNGAAVRIGPSDALSPALPLAYGTPVHIDQYLTNGWCSVTVNGKPGFMKTSDLKQGQYIDSLTPTIKDVSFTGYIKTAGAEFRIAPNSQAPSMISLPKGVVFQATKQANDWYYVTINGASGWVYGAYIENGTYIPVFDPSSPKTPTQTGVISTNGATIHPFPSSQAAPAMPLPAGMTVQIVDSVNGFYYVYVNGYPGYIYTGYVVLIP